MNGMKFTFRRNPLFSEISFVSSCEDMDTGGDLLLVDSTVASIYGGRLGLPKNTLEIPGGEISKTPENLHAIWRAMHSSGLRRDSRVVVIGGGTVCDVCSFAASTWKRGIGLVLVPTTLLCMVDACLGGKTAVNIGCEKNQTGTVYPAGKIHIWTGFLDTLPREEMLNGIAEALKTGVIGDKQIVDHIAEKDWNATVARCLEVKGGIVTGDLEESGARRLLNLGHTVGHGIEAASDFSIPHGQAVAMGMPVAARMAGSHEFAGELAEVSSSVGLSVSIPGSITADEVLEHLGSDKKTTEKGRTWVFPMGWENCVQKTLDPETERRLLTGSWR